MSFSGPNLFQWVFSFLEIVLVFATGGFSGFYYNPLLGWIPGVRNRHNFFLLVIFSFQKIETDSVYHADSRDIRDFVRFPGNSIWKFMLISNLLHIYGLCKIKCICNLRYIFNHSWKWHEYVYFSLYIKNGLGLGNHTFRPTRIIRISH